MNLSILICLVILVALVGGVVYAFFGRRDR
jgi:hypothetical protein